MKKRTYQKKFSLYPATFEQITDIVLNYKPKRKKKKRQKKQLK